MNKDSNEIVTNTLSGNLTCTRNVPTAQLGDSGGRLNVVGGRRIGTCP